ncbi:hypothetical protein CBL_02864 [Carabus blaptoides fortunei]
MNGTKILLMEIDNVRFIDSLNFLPMSLACLVKALDLPSSLKKGYFPHLFNTVENSSYVGPLPGIEFYGANNMHSNHREQFLKWHAEKHLLMTGVCPFTEAVTIASACSKVFRRRFLKHRTIDLIPTSGYRMRHTQSRVALEWLIWEEETRQIRIEHAARGREAVLDGGHKVDGYYAPGKLVFDYEVKVPVGQIAFLNYQINERRMVIGSVDRETTKKLERAAYRKSKETSSVARFSDKKVLLNLMTNNKYYRKTVTEEHIVLVSEPGSKYFGPLTVPSGTAENIEQSLFSFCKKIDSLDLVAVGCNGTAVNTGIHNGVIRRLEVHLNRPLQTIGPSAFSGDIEKKLQICEQLPVVNFQKIDNELSKIDFNILSNDQKYRYEISFAVSFGEVSLSLAYRQPGKMAHSRWLTTANRILRLYVATSNPSENLVHLAEYIQKVYVPTWFDIKVQSLCKYGPLHLFNIIKRSRYLSHDLRTIVNKTIQTNGCFAHSKNLLLAMLGDTRLHIRKLALRHILKCRSQKSATLRKFKLPKINFNATDYIELIEWHTTNITEPPITKKFSDHLLKTIVGSVPEEIEILKCPCHSQAVERDVKLVTEASTLVCGAEARDGFIRARISSRTVMPNFNTKSEFFKNMSRIKEIMELVKQNNDIVDFQVELGPNLTFGSNKDTVLIKTPVTIPESYTLTVVDNVEIQIVDISECGTNNDADYMSMSLNNDDDTYQLLLPFVDINNTTVLSCSNVTSVAQESMTTNESKIESVTSASDSTNTDEDLPSTSGMVQNNFQERNIINDHDIISDESENDRALVPYSEHSDSVDSNLPRKSKIRKMCFQVIDIRALKFTPTGELFYKLRFTDQWETLRQRKKATTQPCPLDQLDNLYPDRLTIKGRKFNELQEFKKVLDVDFHEYYKNIPHE